MKKTFLIIVIFISIIFSLIPVTSTYSFNKSEEKNIYLTFDDGPSKNVLPKILDILKEKNVKATFFVIGKEIEGKEDILKRVFNEGHSIGLHSFSHERNNIYSSNENFLNEMIKTQKLIKKEIGISPNILRFPFGTNNMTYRITPSMVSLLHNNNFKIYDWNIDSGDGASPNASSSTYIKNSKSNKDNIILLMHCADINKNTIGALPSIIDYYKSKDYNFKVIDENTKEEFHYIK